MDGQVEQLQLNNDAGLIYALTDTSVSCRCLVYVCMAGTLR